MAELIKLPEWALEKLKKQAVVLYSINAPNEMLDFLSTIYKAGYRYGYSMGKTENEPRPPDGN